MTATSGGGAGLPANASPADLLALVPIVLEAISNAGIPMLVMSELGSGGELARVYANDSYVDLLGYDRATFSTISAFGTVVADSRGRMYELVAKFRDGQPIPRVIEMQLLHRDGSAITVEATVARQPRPTGDYYVAVIRTGRPPMPAASSLLEADRIALVGVLSAGVAHEINNPLTSVLLNVHTLRKHLSTTSLPAGAMRSVDDIAVAVERIAANVRALQSLAARSSAETIDLQIVLATSLKLAGASITSYAKLERDVAPARVVGEPSRIGQAVLAMLLFSHSGFHRRGIAGANWIHVGIGVRGDRAVVEVSDNGSELSAEETSRAFDPFFHSSSRGAGVGVGLAVARAVATTLGGDVTLAPRDGGGAVVTMRLPAVS